MVPKHTDSLRAIFYSPSKSERLIYFTFFLLLYYLETGEETTVTKFILKLYFISFSE